MAGQTSLQASFSSKGSDMHLEAQMAQKGLLVENMAGAIPWRRPWNEATMLGMTGHMRMASFSCSLLL